MLTCRVGPVLVGRLARLAVADAIHGQDSEGVVNMRGQAKLRCGGGTFNLRQVGPNAWLVEQILVLDQELWRKVPKQEKRSDAALDMLRKTGEHFLLCVGLLCSSPGIQVSLTLLSVWSVISRSVGGSGLSVNPTTGPRIKLLATGNLTFRKKMIWQQMKCRLDRVRNGKITNPLSMQILQ